MKNKAVTILSALILIIVVAMSIYVTIDESLLSYLKEFVSGNGLVSVFFFILLITLGIVFAPVTIWPIIPTVAVIFGPFLAGLYTVIGWTLGSVMAFLIARYSGKPVLLNFVSLEKISQYESKIPKEEHFLWLVFLRVIIPVDILSYALGFLSSVSLPVFVLSTFIGVAPFSFVISYGGKALIEGNKFIFISSLVIGLAIFLFAYFILRTRRRESESCNTKRGG